MSLVTDGNRRRREPRFQITDTRALEVTLHHVGKKTAPIHAELMDLSRCGLRLLVKELLAKNDELRLVMKANALALTLDVRAKVCWVTPTTGDGWFLGCALAERIDDNEIASLAQASVIERRRDARQAADLRAEAKAELGDTFAPVQLINYSAGGFRGLSSAPIAGAGDRLMLRVHATDRQLLVRGKVAWASQWTEGHAFGCSFVSHQDFLGLQSILNPDSRGRWLRSLQRHRPTKWSAVAAAALLLLALQLFHTYHARPDLVRQFRQVVRNIQPWVQRVEDSLF